MVRIQDKDGYRILIAFKFSMSIEKVKASTHTHTGQRNYLKLPSHAPGKTCRNSSMLSFGWERRARESLSNFQFIKFRHSPGQCCNMLKVFAPGIPKGGSLYSTQVILSMTATESTMGTGCMGYDVTDARYGSKQGNQQRNRTTL